MEVAVLASGVVAVLDVVVAGALVWHARRESGMLPSLVILLAAFFVVRAVSRVVAIVFGFTHSLEVGTDIVLLFLLVALFIRARHLAHGMSVATDAARVREHEYQRALAHYSQVVRHRIANPLTVIRGAAQTLDAGVGDEAVKRELVRAILESSEVLENVSLGPRREGPEEHELSAVPDA